MNKDITKSGNKISIKPHPIKANAKKQGASLEEKIDYLIALIEEK
jgi:hypothetical protein